MSFNMFNRKERELAIDKAFFEAEQAEIERAMMAEKEAQAKAEEFNPDEVSFNTDPSLQNAPISTPEDLTFNTDPSLQNENYKGDELATQVRDSARTQSEDSLGGKPSVATQIASDREDTPEKGPQPVYTPDGPRVSFGGHSERKSAAGARAKASDGGGLLGPRRGRQIKQGIGRIWYGLTGQDEKQAGIIASQESQDLRGKAVKAGLVTPDEVRDEETADTLLANAINYLDPSIPDHKRGVPMSPTEAKRKEDMARRIIAEARDNLDPALADAWKYLPEDLRRSALKSQGFEYDEVSPAERARGMDVDPDTEGIQEPSRLAAARKAREAREAEEFNPDDFTFKKPGSRPYTSVAEDFIGPMIQVESGGKADAKNPNSSATGRSQFIKSTWLEMIEKYRPDLMEGKTRQEILDLRKDPAIDREMAIRFTEENAAKLDRLGYALTKRNLYLMHFAGPSDAPKLLAADRNDFAYKYVGSRTPGANLSVFYHGKYVRNPAGKRVFRHETPKKHKTVGEVLDWADKFA